MNKEQREAEIDRLCDEAGCSDKVRKIHYKQFVNNKWHPHPPKEFCDWWSIHHDHTFNGINAKRAYNCQCYQQEYLAAREHGAA